MIARIRRFLSHDCSPFEQFLKYGAIGVASTLVQMAVFYALAATLLPCLKADDWAVRLLALPAAAVSDAVRGMRFAFDTAVGFVAANVFCWLMNRWFVFRPGRFAWYREFLMFFGTAALAMVLATGASTLLIRFTGMMTSLAMIVEVVVSFAINYFVRKFFIFRG